MLIVGTGGAETEISGASGKLIVGIDDSSWRFIAGTGGVESGKLMTGTEIDGTLFTWIEGASGK